MQLRASQQRRRCHLGGLKIILARGPAVPKGFAATAIRPLMDSVPSTLGDDAGLSRGRVPRTWRAARDERDHQLFRKTTFCCFFSRTGRCDRGDGCHFAHGYDELRSKPSLQKTALCKLLECEIDSDGPHDASRAHKKCCCDGPFAKSPHSHRGKRRGGSTSWLCRASVGDGQKAGN